ncbi:peptidylprolyl isomerase [uncultured Polaribacter sp.]|uniref:peptidylprolyl isomerase n=1 Tax=uncultured Polaribacter sp. TaxID=174711 RepID=UPI00262FED67|nr:peptidylprolyl isomerase [uncultured Polaribacter sp.]
MKKVLLLLVLISSCAVLSTKEDAVLLTIDNEKIKVSEFKRVFEKNLDAIDNDDAKDVSKNLDLFINYKLKVKEAYNIKLDTLPSYIKEMATYKNQLSAPYMQDTTYLDKLVKDAYFRTKNEIKAKHILIRLNQNADPKDTLIAYNKIINARNRIINGEDFGDVAVELSDDPSAKGDLKRGRKANKGNLGYFSAFKMVYPFENAAYNTKIGEVSMPFKTKYGYHILQVDSLRQSQGEVEVAHILIADVSIKGKEKANEVYKKLVDGEQFKDLAFEYSNDNGTKSKGGKLNKFGKGLMVKPFEDAAFSLKNIDDYSMPFKTRFGWHIVKLIKKHPIKSFEESKDELTSKIKRSSLSQLSEKAVIDKLKSKYQIFENSDAKKVFDRKDIREISKDSLQEIILIINDKKISQEEFVNSIKYKKNNPVFKLYEKFKDTEILKYYKENLVNTEPEYANILKEYEDGLLLFELMQQKIWNKSAKDSIGLKNYFDANAEKYTSKELEKIKGMVMSDYQNHLEKSWIADLKRKSVVNVNKKQLNNLIEYYKKQ